MAKQQLAQLQQQAELIEKMSLMLTNMIDSLGAHIKTVNKVGQGGLLGLFSGMEPRLRQALDRLPEAAPHIQQRCYMSALAVHDAVGRTMLTVYREKLNAIAAQVNSLINRRDAHNHGRFDYDFALKRIPSPADIATASHEEIHTLYSDLNQAWERLKTACSSAKAEIRRQEQRRRQQRSHRASSSSSSSYHSSSSSSRRSSSSSRRSSSSGSSRRSSNSHGSSRRR